MHPDTSSLQLPGQEPDEESKEEFKQAVKPSQPKEAATSPKTEDSVPSED